MNLIIRKVDKIIFSSLCCLALLSIPASEITTCTQGGSDSWSATLTVFTPLNFLLILIAIFAEQGSLRYSLILAVPLSFWGAFNATKYTLGTTIKGRHFCTVWEGDFSGQLREGIEPWFYFWGPIQLLITLLWVVMAIYHWRLIKSCS